MKDWFYGLQQRERMFVGVGAVLTLFVLLWGLLWVPLDKGHTAMRENVADWERYLEELRPLGFALNNVNSGTPAQANVAQTPVVVVDQTLRARGLNNSLKRRQPTPNGIRVEFENVAFDDLVLWLGDLSSRYAMEVQAGSMTVASRAGPGRINAALTLERSL